MSDLHFTDHPTVRQDDESFWGFDPVLLPPLNGPINGTQGRQIVNRTNAVDISPSSALLSTSLPAWRPPCTDRPFTLARSASGDLNSVTNGRNGVNGRNGINGIPHNGRIENSRVSHLRPPLHKYHTEYPREERLFGFDPVTPSQLSDGMPNGKLDGPCNGIVNGTHDSPSNNGRTNGKRDCPYDNGDEEDELACRLRHCHLGCGEKNGDSKNVAASRWGNGFDRYRKGCGNGGGMRAKGNLMMKDK